jgi:hypothetical protein
MTHCTMTELREDHGGDRAWSVRWRGGYGWPTISRRWSRRRCDIWSRRVRADWQSPCRPVAGAGRADSFGLPRANTGPEHGNGWAAQPGADGLGPRRAGGHHGAGVSAAGHARRTRTRSAFGLGGGTGEGLPGWLDADGSAFGSAALRCTVGSGMDAHNSDGARRVAVAVRRWHAGRSGRRRLSAFHAARVSARSVRHRARDVSEWLDHLRRTGSGQAGRRGAVAERRAGRLGGLIDRQSSMPLRYSPSHE